MEVFGMLLNRENPWSFFDLKVNLISMALTDTGKPKEVVEEFIQRMKKANKPVGSILEQFSEYIKDRLSWFYSPENSSRGVPLFEKVAADLAKCCALTSGPLRHVPDLEYPVKHPWTLGELESEVEKGIVKYLLELVDFWLKKVGMEEEAEDFKVKLQVAATAGFQGFQSVKVLKEIMLRIETSKLVVVSETFSILERGNPPLTPHTLFPTPPSNWQPAAPSTMGSHFDKVDKVTEAVTLVEGSSGRKRKEVADADGVGPSSIKKLKPL